MSAYLIDTLNRKKRVDATSQIGIDWISPGDRAQQEASKMDYLESTIKYYGQSKSYTYLYKKDPATTEEVISDEIEAVADKVHGDNGPDNVIDHNKVDVIEHEEVPTKQEISINVPVPKLQRHFEAIAKRKQLSEAEMVSLAQELCVLATYKQQQNVVVENCSFSVGLLVGDDALSVTFYLKQVKGKDKKKITWRQFVSKSLIAAAPSDTAIAHFTVNSAWEIVTKELRADALRLLTPARILVREQLGVSEIEALDDIEYFEAAAEAFDD